MSEGAREGGQGEWSWERGECGLQAILSEDGIRVGFFSRLLRGIAAVATIWDLMGGRLRIGLGKWFFFIVCFYFFSSYSLRYKVDGYWFICYLLFDCCVFLFIPSYSLRYKIDGYWFVIITSTYLALFALWLHPIRYINRDEPKRNSLANSIPRYQRLPDTVARIWDIPWSRDTIRNNSPLPRHRQRLNGVCRVLSARGPKLRNPVGITKHWVFTHILFSDLAAPRCYFS